MTLSPQKSISTNESKRPSPSGTTSNSSPGSPPTKKSKKGTSAQNLSAEEKKLRHIQSEHKRREQIRSTFDKLVRIIPSLEQKESRSELVVLNKTSDYLEELRQQRQKLVEAAKLKGIDIPEELLK
ncbi:unnamed protein product [Ambrosiozyma monospora]|uniref:Unnamed protein product n=1 Tax=Ambrosiozyma monospora TaxID=43982 RepID=A0A9W6YTY0_AMBMO|nr:unnamed protein product [Ambrosiozyma monospora]